MTADRQPESWENALARVRLAAVHLSADELSRLADALSARVPVDGAIVRCWNKLRQQQPDPPSAALVVPHEQEPSR